MKKRTKVLIVILAILVVTFIGSLIFVVVSPRAKFLASQVRVATESLGDPHFIIYNLDIMDVCRNYLNGDIEFEGDVIAGDIKGFGYTSSAKVHGVRCPKKRELGATAQAKVLFLDVGEVDVFAKDETVYMIVPSFDNLAYSLDTGVDLFMRAPDLNGNLSVDWFVSNIGNFIDFANSITFDKTGEVLEDEDGTVSDEYKITIPVGEGKFIWDLLGYDMPEDDITFSMYISKMCKIRRIVVDISKFVDDTVVTVDGFALGTVIVESELPDNEHLTITATRRGDYLYASYIDFSFVYNTKDGNVYSGDGVFSYEKVDDGYDIQIKRLKAYKDGSLIGQVYFDGNVHPTTVQTNPTQSATVPLDSIKKYEWVELRDNAQAVIDDIMEDVKAKL